MVRSLLFLTLACYAGPVYAQTIVNADFEAGLTGWTASGTAFQGQPIAASGVTIEVVRPIPIGGSYWRDVPYPLGQSGAQLIRSAPGAGTLTSDPFPIRSDDGFFSLRIGGTSDPSRARVELQVAPAGARPSDPPSYAALLVITGRGPAQLQQQVFAIPEAMRGRLARVVIFDDASGEDGTIAVDTIALSAGPPAPFRLPIWGIGDYHTHPHNYMGFGALNGPRMVWGVPGTAFRDYELVPDLITRDLPACTPGHRGGPSAELVIDQVEGRLDVTSGGMFRKLVQLLLHGRRHGRHGAPGFQDHPSFRSGLHYQMHITQVHRAWEGGLRLMTAIAVHNQGVEFLASPLVGGRVNPSRDRAVLDAQVCGMRQLAALNHDWMDIAYSPQDVRDIISRGKLAIVLGAEFDQLGQLDGFDSADEEVQYLWDIGIRQVTPIHAVDNRLGGAAVFQPAYNFLNDLLNRGAFNLRAAQLDQVPPRFFDVGEGCKTHQPGECVLFKLEPDQQRAAIVRLGRERPFLQPVTVVWPQVEGMVNTSGLTSAGAAYLRSLMKRGMLIGLEHMSQHSVEHTYAVIGQDLDARGSPECAAIGRLSVPSSCFDAAYPLEFSHAHLRRMSVQKREEHSIEGFLPSEYEMSDSQAVFLRRSGGFVGHFVAEDPVEWPADRGPLPIANDCGGSSKSFATSLLYALHAMGGKGVGLATDLTIIDGVAPRFGDRACWPARGNNKKQQAQVPGQYGQKQTHPVRYRSTSAGAPADALEPYRMGDRVFDYNTDGLAHYGLLPDFLQDLRNVELPAAAFDALFSSAEHYTQTWEKAQRISGSSPAPFLPKPLPCEIACRGLCPESLNAGAPAAKRSR
jgi:microsomal dipeptidase-like Zn-dependent dipeptidase